MAAMMANFLATSWCHPFCVFGILEAVGTYSAPDETKMTRRAAIYIRTSSETQGEKSSPVEQEADCRHLAKEMRLEVVHVYRDMEKYRVSNKLVEPSGSRSDRPGLLAMLQDASRDEFDVILA